MNSFPSLTRVNAAMDLGVLPALTNALQRDSCLPDVQHLKYALEQLEAMGYTFAAFMGSYRPFCLEQFSFYTPDPSRHEFFSRRLDQQALLLRFLSEEQAQLPLPQQRLQPFALKHLGDYMSLLQEDAFQELCILAGEVAEMGMGFVMTITVRAPQSVFSLQHLFLHNGLFDIEENFETSCEGVIVNLREVPVR